MNHNTNPCNYTGMPDWQGPEYLSALNCWKSVSLASWSVVFLALPFLYRNGEYCSKHPQIRSIHQSLHVSWRHQLWLHERCFGDWWIQVRRHQLRWVLFHCLAHTHPVRMQLRLPFGPVRVDRRMEKWSVCLPMISFVMERWIGMWLRSLKRGLH